MTIESARDQLILLLAPLYENREAAAITHMVLEHLTGMNKTDRLIHKQLELTSAQQEQYTLICADLLNGRPLQYILGEAWFLGMKFMVNEHTLIPRPETEELIEWIKAVINPEPQTVIDIGTGTGCIPIALKKEFPLWNITAIDVSEAALKVAQHNAMINQVQIDIQSINFLEEKLWSTMPQFDLIISNPPYIRKSEMTEMSKHVVDHEPHLALFVPDDDALVFYRKIGQFGLTHLKEKGKLFLEINQVLGKAVCELLDGMGYTAVLRQDLHGNDRMVMAGLITDY